MAKSLVAQLDPPGVSNEDVQGSNPISSIVIVDFIYIKMVVEVFLVLHENLLNAEFLGSFH